MSSFNEAMTQIRELEERAIEELKEIVQVGSWPWHIHSLQARRCAQHQCLNVTWASGWPGKRQPSTLAFLNSLPIHPSILLGQLIPHPLP